MRLHGQFMSSEMVAFAMGGRGGRVRVGSKVMQFCDPIMRTLWHRFSPLYEMPRLTHVILDW
jgi:hypothetical protein